MTFSHQAVPPAPSPEELFAPYRTLESATQAQTQYDSVSLIQEMQSARGLWGLHHAPSAAEVRAHLSGGAPINGVKRIDYGDTLGHFETPLLTSLVDERYAAAEALIIEGADVDAANSVRLSPTSGFAHTALHMMVSREDLRGVQLLVSHGADVNRRTTAGATPLHFAAGDDNLRIASYLVTSGARIDLPDSQGKTPLDEAGPGVAAYFRQLSE